MIILICAILQVVAFLGLFNESFNYIYQILVLRSGFEYIIARPWTLITHMFLHDQFGVFHILFNMITLYFFGTYLEKIIGKRSFIIMYLISGIVAALGFILFQDPNVSVGLVGASGAIFGVLGAVAVLNPNLQVYVYFIPMKIKYMIVIFALISLLLMGNDGSMIAHAAHLSGIVVGLGFGYYYRNRLRHQNQQKYY